MLDESELIKHILVDIHTPAQEDIDVETAVRQEVSEASGDEGDSLIPSILQRGTLYFDETFTSLAVVRLPYDNDEQALKLFILRLTVRLEAVAINYPPIAPDTRRSQLDQTSSQVQDVVWAGDVDTSQEPVMVIERETEDGEDQGAQYALLIWKVKSTLNRPKVRLHSPALRWRIQASIEPMDGQQGGPSKNKYLPNGVPLPMNLLEPLRYEPTSSGPAPYLSAARLLNKPTVSRPGSSQSITLRTLHRRPIRASPALSSRIRFHRSHKIGAKLTTVASLELEIPPVAQNAIVIDKISLQLTKGTVKSVSGQTLNLPWTAHARDNLTWLYTLSPNGAPDDFSNGHALVQPLDVEIEARALVSETCKPCVSIKWRTNVDFNSALHTIRADPSQLSKDLRQRVPRPAPIPGHASFDAAQQANVLDLTITFISRETPETGRPFKWEIVVVNRSKVVKHLMLSIVPKRRRQGARRHSHQSSTGSALGASKTTNTAEAIVDDNLVHANMKQYAPEPSQLVSLTAEVRMGPIEPGAAAATSVKLLPLSAGWLQFEAVRIRNMATNESVDIRDLPDIMVLENLL